MSDRTSPHVVLGATGGAGRAVVHELVHRGLPVRAVSRSGGHHFPEGVEVMSADCMDPEAARTACTNASLVYHCINLPYNQWTQGLPTLAENCIAAARQAEASLVVMDNLYMYGRPNGPMTENTPRDPTGPKGEVRAEVEHVFLEAHEKDQVQVALGRASDFYGPHANSSTRDLVFKPALEGSTAAWLGSLTAPHTMSYLRDVGRGLVTLGTNQEAFGEVWHLPSNDPITGRQFIEKVYEHVGRTPSMRAYGYWMLSLAGLFNTQAWEAREVLYQFEEPFIMDTSKFENAFGRTVTPYETAIRETLRWHEQERT